MKTFKIQTLGGLKRIIHNCIDAQDAVNKSNTGHQAIIYMQEIDNENKNE